MSTETTVLKKESSQNKNPSLTVAIFEFAAYYLRVPFANVRGVCRERRQNWPLYNEDRKQFASVRTIQRPSGLWLWLGNERNNELRMLQLNQRNSNFRTIWLRAFQKDRDSNVLQKWILCKQGVVTFNNDSLDTNLQVCDDVYQAKSNFNHFRRADVL